MKVTLIRTDKEHGKEALSTCETGALFEKIKTETKSGHITALRNILPALEGTHSQYEHIDKLPRIYPAVEYTRTKEGERRMKQYNGLVQLEVNKLAGMAEVEYVKQQAALLYLLPTLSCMSVSYRPGNRLRHWCSSIYLRILPLHMEFHCPLLYSSLTVSKAVWG